MILTAWVLMRLPSLFLIEKSRVKKLFICGHFLGKKKEKTNFIHEQISQCSVQRFATFSRIVQSSIEIFKLYCRERRDRIPKITTCRKINFFLLKCVQVKNRLAVRYWNHYFMMHVDEGQTRKLIVNSDDTDDSTEPFYETEVFYSIWEALKWKYVRARVPVWFRKTLRSRYMLANLVYLGYTIGILIIDFNFRINESTDTTSTNDTETTTVVISILDQPTGDKPIVNRLYFGKIDSNVPYESWEWWDF